MFAYIRKHIPSAQISDHLLCKAFVQPKKAILTHDDDDYDDRLIGYYRIPCNFMRL